MLFATALVAAATRFDAAPARAQDAPEAQSQPPAQPAAQPPAQPAAPPASPEEAAARLPGNRMWYPVSRFTVRYFAPAEGGEEVAPKLEAQAPIAQIMNVPIELSVIEQGLIAPAKGDGLPRERFALGSAPPSEYSLSAVQSISTDVVKHLTGRGLMGVWVEAEGIGPEQDRRTSDEMVFVIKVGVVDELRTLAEGKRVPPERRMNTTRPLHEGAAPDSGFANQEHRWVIEQSPVKVGDVLSQKKLEEYIFRLSRHPGRRVDLALSSAEREPGVVVDYLISENKPWLVYAQISNTGTEQTSRLRERFGFIQNQLTGDDDILTLDYITANFDDSHAVLGSYDRPLDEARRWRGRVFGSWSEYTASDVGFAGEDFTGESLSAGGEVTFNVYQNRELFVDLLGGARWENIEVVNEAVLIEGEGSFFVPYFGAKLERITDVASSLGSVVLEFATTAGGTDEDDLTRLGRFAPDENWMLLRWDGLHSFYLEPLLDKRWKDPNAPGSKLAHEIQAIFRGQYAFNQRLIPQAEQVVGGLYSVRGYPESIVAGDTVIIGSLEYRLHVPKVMGVKPEPYEPKQNSLASKIFGEQFRFVPAQAFGGTDWDLILKAFVDAGQTIISDAFVFEQDETLIGAGIGFELVFRRNLSVRVDWGFVLNDIELADVETGDNRVHFVATFLF